MRFCTIMRVLIVTIPLRDDSAGFRPLGPLCIIKHLRNQKVCEADLYDIDFSRRNEYSHYNDVERKAIDLMRRKMLVSQTRAVEQLIILKTPLNEIIQLGGQETSMKSVNTMDYSEVSKICQLKHVKELSKLQENLAEFFKASKIKDIHISIKRISEGLKLKNRSGSESVKKEYPKAKQSVLQKAKYEEKKFDCQKQS